MEKQKLPLKNRLILSPSPLALPPSPIPTGKGSRSAADPILSEYIDKSIEIPELTLPQHAHPFKPEEIDYESLVLREKDEVRRLLRSGEEFGVFHIVNHGISTEELRFALANSERIFGLTVESCAGYGDHEKLVWTEGGRRIMEKAPAVIVEHNFQIFR